MLSLMPNPQQHEGTGRLMTQIEHFNMVCKDPTYPIRNLNDVSVVPIPVHDQEMEWGIVGDIYVPNPSIKLCLLLSPLPPPALLHLSDNKGGSLFVDPTMPSV